ncbi:WXG100 family type VII secretion target [Bacillus zhangzhouensis]|nr:WXG100 family type VII secretion target [Bacillus zhangzhouensis]
MRKLDSSQTLALAQTFQEAADEIRQSKQLLENRLKAVGSGWQGEARDKFDQSRFAHKGCIFFWIRRDQVGSAKSKY